MLESVQKLFRNNIFSGQFIFHILCFFTFILDQNIHLASMISLINSIPISNKYRFIINENLSDHYFLWEFSILLYLEFTSKLFKKKA